MIVAFSEIPKVNLLWHMRCRCFLASDKVRREPIHRKEDSQMNTITTKDSTGGFSRKLPAEADQERILE
jgi:hypothetical protein